MHLFNGTRVFDRAEYKSRRIVQTGILLLINQMLEVEDPLIGTRA